MQFYLINSRTKLHHQKWRKLRVTLPVNMATVPSFLNFTINAVLRPTFIRKLCYKLPSIVTFTFIQIFDQNFVFRCQICRVCFVQRQNSRYFKCPDLKNEKLIKSKPIWKLKHANSMLESCEYFCQISSKLFVTILSYTVSKLVHFSRHSVVLVNGYEEIRPVYSIVIVLRFRWFSAW